MRELQLKIQDNRRTRWLRAEIANAERNLSLPEVIWPNGKSSWQTEGERLPELKAELTSWLEMA